MRRLVCLAVLTACKFQPNNLGDGGPVGDDDARPDAPPIKMDAPDAKCFGAGDFYFCLSAEPTGSVSFGGLAGNFDTDNDCTGGNSAEVVMVGEVTACAIRGGTLMVDTQFPVRGTRPLVLAASQDIVIANGATLDVSGGGQQAGPGSNPSVCDDPQIDGVSDPGGAGGGAGGSFVGKGGDGGRGLAVGAGGGLALAPIASVTTLRGGCHGGKGQPGNMTQAFAGGSGGGALLLASHQTIQVMGLVNASGGGALGGPASRNSGAGGGSGGLIVFHTTTLTVSGGKVVATGGGGGGGGGNAGSGDPGSDIDPNMIESPARGGQTTSGGATQGGNGAAEQTPATNGAPGAGGGGGGGGGGNGAVRVIAGAAPTSLPGSSFSPAPTN
jgi:hypothetical protein